MAPGVLESTRALWPGPSSNLMSPILVVVASSASTVISAIQPFTLSARLECIQNGATGDSGGRLCWLEKVDSGKAKATSKAKLPSQVELVHGAIKGGAKAKLNARRGKDLCGRLVVVRGPKAPAISDYRVWDACDLTSTGLTVFKTRGGREEVGVAKGSSKV